MISKTFLACVLLALAVLVGCASTSGGGSQTNWVTCKTNRDCAAGTCVQGVCRNSSASKDAGAADGTATGPSSSGALGPWELAADYPLATNNCAGESPNLYCPDPTCVAGSDSIYCLGGASASTYYSKVSSGRLGAWVPGTSYPVSIREPSCAISSSYIYCVGGNVGGADGGASIPSADAYYAPLLSPGIGAWAASTPFPHVTSAPQCMIDSGYIYCVSRNPADATSPDAYYAPISSNGIGAWVPTAGPPTNTAGCSSAGGFAYCVGGGNCPPDGPYSDCYSPSYFAPLTASGIGTWKATNALPTAASAGQATAGSYIYTLSVPVFFASVSAEGIGPWKTTTNYPRSKSAATCVSTGGYLFCAGAASGVYSARIGVSNPQALELENPPPFPRSDYLGPAWVDDGGCSVSQDGVFAGAPCFSGDIDEAFVFDCASQASTPDGCKTTVVSSDTRYNFDVTVWYPCANSTGTDTNCCFLPSVGYDTAFKDWCISVGSNSFIIAKQLTIRQSQ